MNKTELIDALAARFEGNRKAAAFALESVLDTITREVAKGEKVAITGFGSFEKRVREARWVRNPRTGERLMAEKTAIPRFSAGAELKSVVAGLRELPQLALDTAASALPGGRSKSAKPAAPATKAAAKKAPATKSAAKKAPATKAAAKKAPATKAAAKKAPATKPAAKKAPATKAAAKKAPATKAAATTTATTSAAKKAPAAKKTATKKTATKKAAPPSAAKKTS